MVRTAVIMKAASTLLLLVPTAAWVTDGALGVSRRTTRQPKSRMMVSQEGKVTSTETSKFDWALLFDCDGVIVETEELHRLAYNGAFEAFGLEIDGKPVSWDVPYYDILQNTVGGGKPKMKHFFTETAKAWPICTTREGSPSFADATEEARMALIDDLQDKKTEIYKGIVSEVAEPRPGVLELMDAAIATPGLAVGICSAATRGGFDKVVDALVGQDRLAKLDVIIAGDDVTAKKPDPMIYDLARERLGISDPRRCVVIEDSMVGLRAAKGANMRCLITYTDSTSEEDFYGFGADAKVPDLGVGVTVDNLFGPIMADESTVLLEGLRDPITVVLNLS